MPPIKRKNYTSEFKLSAIKREKETVIYDFKKAEIILGQNETESEAESCVADLYNFGKQRIDERIDKTLKVNSNLHNQTVKKNREVLKRLIDVTCFLAKQELPFRGHNEKTSSLNQGNYVETLNLLKLYDPVLAEHFENSTVFKGTSNDIQNELISIISEELIETIKREVEEADFVALILDEALDIRRRSQLSTV
nr:zinc finger MYM-type protein 1 [Parasteatoda tepidariorum]